MSRDFAAEMRALIDAETKGAYESRLVASHIVQKLRATDVELLTGWLDAQAEDLLWKTINERDASLRTRARTGASRSAFSRDAEAYSKGDKSALTRWLSVPFTLSSNLRKPLGDMTRDEVLDSAGVYDDKAKRNGMTAAFLKAIAKRVRKGQTIRDHYTDEQLDDMWRSIVQ